jgi:hypothetical protein
LLALYGLRRSPRLWQKELGSALKEIGLRQSTEDPCLSTNDFIIVLFFVGDFILLSRKEHRDKLGLDTEHDITIECDNQQTVGLLIKDEPELRTKLKHVDIHHHWLRQEVQAKRLLIDWIPTADMPADGFTKILPRQKHEKFKRVLRLIDIKDRIAGQ